MVVVNIKWCREKTGIDFEDRGLSDIQLGELRQRCHEWSTVPINGLTLISTGAIMKDNNAPLSSFGIKPNGVITMMGTKSSKSDIRTAPLTTTSGSGGDPEEHALVIEIQTSYKKILDLTDQHVPKYERAVKEYIQSNNPPSVMDLKNEYGGERPMRKWLLDEYTLLSEKLMQALLVLDSVICKPNFEVARAKRKEAVKETQRLLDLIDEMNARVKTYDETAEATGKL